MEFSEVIRRRRMVRSYTTEEVGRELVDRVVDAGRRAPSAGFSQGWAFVVLEGAATAPFWESVRDPSRSWEPGGRWERLRRAPVVILPLAHKQAYLDRYAEADKADTGMADEARWPVPYWDVDTAFATMAMLLAATDAGLGALFFGIAHGEAELLRRLQVPDGFRPIGAITLGWPDDADPPSPSLARGHRDRHQVVHYGHWGGRS